MNILICFLEYIPFSKYIETNYGRAINSIYDTAYVLCSKKHDAYIKLIDDDADLIFCAAPSDEEIEESGANNRELILTPIDKEAFVFFLNSKNKTDNLSKENIKDIYTEKINNWKILYGDNMKIKAYQRNKYRVSQSEFIRFTASMNAKNDIMVLIQKQ